MGENDPVWDDNGSIDDAIVDIRDVFRSAVDASLIGQPIGTRHMLQAVLKELVRKNVMRALTLASHGVRERLNPDEFDGEFADGLIPIPEAARIVRELDFRSNPYGPAPDDVA